MITPDEFVNLFKNEKQTKTVRFGIITDASENPRVQLDGEESASIKRYTRLASYTPAVGDSVMILHGVIMGKIV